jgi:membrane fusion protein (multidrug efflux system)
MTRFRRNTTWICDVALLILLIGCVASFATCSRGTAASPPPAITVEVATVIQRDTPIYSEWVATLEGYVNADIQPRVSGYIVKQNYREGALVRKGDVLFEVDPRPLIAARDQANAQLAQAEAQRGKASLDVERDTPLAEARAIARSQLDTEVQAKLAAEASVLAARANVEQAELNLEFTKVTSLVSGIAGIARVQIGNLVGPTSILTSISQVDPIKAYFTVSEQVFLDFHRRFPTERSVDEQRKRMPLQLILGDGSSYEHVGKISFADREVSTGTGTIRVAGVFPNPDTLLRPGGYGRIRLSTRTAAGAMLIPQRAVTELQGSYQVAVVGSDNRVSVRPVTVGDRVRNLWIVTDGLKAGERVIVEGLLKARDGAFVTVVPGKSPGARD